MKSMPSLFPSWFALVRALSFAFAFLASGTAFAAAHRDVEPDFAAHRGDYSHVEGETDEPSCGGTSLGVYLDGRRIKKLEYTIETSRHLIHLDYYFEGSDLALVVETMDALLDKQGERAKLPKVKSKRRFWIADTPAPKRKELLDHADYLIHYYRGHASDFKRTRR